jgi:signal transduction histidine kinase
MWINSIKKQTLVLLVGLTLSVGFIFSSLAVVTAFVVEDSVISNFIDQQATQIESHHAQHNQLPALSANTVKVFSDIDAVPQWAQQYIDPGKTRGEIFTPDATHYHYQILNLGADKPAYLLAEVSKLLVVTHQPRIPIIFIATFFIATIFTIFIAINFSQKIVKPILTLTNAVKLNEKLAITSPLPTLKHELGYLSDALQGSFNKLSDTLEREKTFATNVSHELRTPLTVLKNTCVLISQRGFTTEDLSQITSASEQMVNTVNVLLSLARTEPMTAYRCNLVMALEQAILRCHTSTLEHFQIDINVPHDLVVLANNDLLNLLFVNLFRNAAEHASEPKITIEYIDKKLIFENKAKDIPIYDVTQAGIKGDKSEGLGQGLYLVARIAERLGWTLSVTSMQQRFRIIINLL